MILRHGFGGLTLRAIADEADIRLATLQYYFPNKAMLFEAVIEAVAEAAWEKMIGALDSQPNATADERLRNFLGALFDTSQDSDLAGLFMELWLLARLDPFATDTMQRYYDEAIGLLGDLIGACLPKLNRRSCRERAVLALATVDGLTVLNSSDGQIGQLRKSVAVDTLVNIAVA